MNRRTVSRSRWRSKSLVRSWTIFRPQECISTVKSSQEERSLAPFGGVSDVSRMKIRMEVSDMNMKRWPTREELSDLIWTDWAKPTCDVELHRRTVLRASDDDWRSAVSLSIFTPRTRCTVDGEEEWYLKRHRIRAISSNVEWANMKVKWQDKVVYGDLKWIEWPTASTALQDDPNVWIGQRPMKATRSPMKATYFIIWITGVEYMNLDFNEGKLKRMKFDNNQQQFGLLDWIVSRIKIALTYKTIKMTCKSYNWMALVEPPV